MEHIEKFSQIQTQDYLMDSPWTFIPINFAGVMLVSIHLFKFIFCKNNHVCQYFIDYTCSSIFFKFVKEKRYLVTNIYLNFANFKFRLQKVSEINIPCLILKHQSNNMAYLKKKKRKPKNIIPTYYILVCSMEFLYLYNFSLYISNT